MPIPAPATSFKSRLQASAKKTRDDGQTNVSQAPCQDENAKGESNVTASSTIRPTLGRNLSSRSDVEGTKRRSFLPQPGQSRYSTRLSMLPGVRQLSNEEIPPSRDATEPSEPLNSGPTMTAVNAQSNIKERSRPRSMYLIDTIPPERAEKGDDTSTSRLMRPSAPISKPAEPRTIGLVRSQSLHKQGASILAAPLSGPSTQLQTHSTKVTSGTRRDTSNTVVTSEDLKPVQIPPSNSAKVHSIPMATAASGTRSSARLLGLNRLAGTKPRPEILSTSVGSGKAVGTENSVTALPKRQESFREDSKKTARPAFSTLQQHFTPRKVGKAPTATFLHPQPAPGANSLPPEVVTLQAQLLQLHLWHATSSQVSNDWEASAKHSLQKRFEEVSRLYQAMLEYEAAGYEQKNLQSLLEWSNNGASAGLIERIQILSELLHELPSLVEPGGRLQRVVRDFEGWISKVQEVRSARRDTIQSRRSVEPIEGLGDSWKSENAALVRKLTAYSRDLKKLDQPIQGSSIADVVETCKALLEGVLDELHVMQTIEIDVVSEEKQWIEDRVRMIAGDTGANVLGKGVDVEVPLWR